MDDLEKTTEFLAGREIADLVTLMADGSPHVAPVWYKFDGESYVVLAEPSTVKVRNIRRDPRVAVSIASRDRPYGYVLIQGRAEISEGDTDPLLFEMSYRYLGEAEGQAYAVTTSQQSSFVFITITAEKTITYFDS